jgi:hypothetical protein
MSPLEVTRNGEHPFMDRRHAPDSLQVEVDLSSPDATRANRRSSSGRCVVGTYLGVLYPKGLDHTSREGAVLTMENPDARVGRS